MPKPTNWLRASTSWVATRRRSCWPSSEACQSAVSGWSSDAWSLSSKFGASSGEAFDLIEAAFKSDLVVEGLSFHVGSQCTNFANYVQALFLVYILLIFVYILLNMMFSLGLRPPYSRFTDAVMNFLRDVCEPYLRIFRRFIPPIGMFDLTPMIAIILLYIVQTIVVNAIRG